jgi:hypothetical protein
MTSIDGAVSSVVIGKADSLLKAREIARTNQGSESITRENDGTYTVKKIDDAEANRVTQKPSAGFNASIVEFSIQKNGKDQEVTNSNTTFMNKARIKTTDAEELLIKSGNYVETKVNEGIELGKEIILGKPTPKPTDGTVIEGKPSPQIIDDLKAGKVKLPLYVKIVNKDNKEVSYVQINQKVIDSLKEVEFPKDAQVRYGFSDTQDTRDGTVTKGYGCTDVSLHKYLVAGKTPKAEKAAEAVLVYQAITHAQERFDNIPKIFLDHLDDNQKSALISSGFNMSAGMFAGGTARDPNANNPNGFLPVKKMKEAWSELTKGDGKLSMQDVKDALNSSLSSFISGFRDGQSGLQTRRTYDFILSMGGNPGVSSPYGHEDKLVKTLLNMNASEKDPSRKASIQSVIDVLKTFPKWTPLFK